MSFICFNYLSIGPTVPLRSDPFVFRYVDTLDCLIDYLLKSCFRLIKQISIWFQNTLEI